jgi:hypothetical protein
MAPPPPRPNRRNSTSNNSNSSSSKGGDSSTIRTSKRKAGEPDPSPELVPSPRGSKNTKKVKEATTSDDAPLLPPPPPPPQEEEEDDDILEDSQQDKEKRERAIELLRSADDLPSSYAALKLVNEIVGIDEARIMAKRVARLLSPADQVLIDQASLAVPYLMYQLCVEEFTQPRAQGGLAYSHAKAVEMASILFEKAGPACCCADNITELQLVKKCRGGKNNTTDIITKNDARKVLPILKKIGIIARSKIDETIAQLETAPAPEAKVSGSEEELTQQEARQTSSGSEEELAQQEEARQTSNETKAKKDTATEEELPQQEVAVPQAEESKIADDDEQSHDL